MMGENELTTDLQRKLWDVVRDLAKLVPSNTDRAKLELTFYKVTDIETAKTQLGGEWEPWKNTNGLRWFTQEFSDYAENIGIQITLFEGPRRT